MLAAGAILLVSSTTPAHAFDSNTFCSGIGEVAKMAAQDRDAGLTFKQAVRAGNRSFDSYVRDHRDEYSQYTDAQYRRYSGYLRDYIDRVYKRVFENRRMSATVLQEWVLGNCHRVFDSASAPPQRNPDDPNPGYDSVAPEPHTAEE
jgi:hypothetical protein